jgi:hypothetical protein
MKSSIIMVRVTKIMLNNLKSKANEFGISYSSLARKYIADGLGMPVPSMVRGHPRKKLGRPCITLRSENGFKAKLQKTFETEQG